MDYGQASQNLGLAQLMQMLQGGGRLGYGRALGSLGQDVGGLQGMYGGATGDAVGAAGAALAARLRAQDLAGADENQRMNLQMLRDLVIRPNLDMYSIQKQKEAEKKRRKKGKFGSLLGTAGTVIGGIYGGPAGAAVGGAIGSKIGGG